VNDVRDITREARAPNAVGVGVPFTVTLPALTENAPIRVTNHFTRYLVFSGPPGAANDSFIVGGSATVVANAVNNGASLPSEATISADRHGLVVRIAGPIEPGTLVLPEVTFEVYGIFIGHQVDVTMEEIGEEPEGAVTRCQPNNRRLSTTFITDNHTTSSPPPPPTTTGTTSTTIAPGPSLSVSDATATEADRGRVRMTFVVSLSEPASARVRVRAETVDGSADSHTDYRRRVQTLTFRRGQTSRNFLVVLRADRIAEAAETFTVQLSRASGAPISDGIGVGTIVDND
jgi:hypothetical protein